MSLLDYNGQSTVSSWNFTDREKPGFMLAIRGTIVEMAEVQELDYKTKQPKFWQDGGPRLQMRIIIQGASGRELAWYIRPKSKASDALLAALTEYGVNMPTYGSALGLEIEAQTFEGTYNEKNPRPFAAQILGPGKVQHRGFKPFAAPAAQAPAPAAPATPAPAQQQIPAAPEITVYDDEIPF